MNHLGLPTLDQSTGFYRYSYPHPFMGLTVRASSVPKEQAVPIFYNDNQLRWRAMRSTKTTARGGIIWFFMPQLLGMYRISMDIPHAARLMVRAAKTLKASSLIHLFQRVKIGSALLPGNGSNWPRQKPKTKWSDSSPIKKPRSCRHCSSRLRHKGNPA